MTREQKLEWLKNAGNEVLLRQLVNLNAGNSFGKYDEDIELTQNEILRRMEGRA